MQAESKRPNIIVITTDQQRYDSLGATGNAIVRSPHLDRLARDGVLFTHAYCQNTVCIPSRACLHTGRYTHPHGVQYMESKIDTTPTLPPWEKTFMERLQDAGYYTGAVGKIHMMEPKGYHETALTGGKGSRWKQAIGQDIGPAPLGQQYAAWLEAKRPGGYEEIYRQRTQAEYTSQRTAIVNVRDEREYIETWIAEEAVQFLDRRKESSKPFMLWVGFCGPHGPFDPPKRYADMYPIEDMPLPSTYDPNRPGATDEEVVRRVIAHYYALITCVDENIGRILERLDRNGQRENTIVVFTSDHGEMLGDRNRFGKECFFEPVVRIPTIIDHPSVERSFLHDGLVETFSIAPTLLECAGIDIPVEMAADSLMPVLFGQTGKRATKESILCEYTPNDRSGFQVCVRTERHKLVLDFPDAESEEITRSCELYDLENDPLELTNLYHETAARETREELKDIAFGRIVSTSMPAYDSWIHQLPASLRG